MKMLNDFKLFDTVCIDYPKSDNSEQSGLRPSVILQNNIGNKHSPTLIVAPLTTEIKKLGMPTHCLIHKTKENGLKYDSMILAEQIRVVDKERVVAYIGHISDTKTQGEILKSYIANVTGKSNYNDANVNTIWNKIIGFIFSSVREGGSRVAV